MSVIGDEHGWDDVAELAALEELELEAEHDEPDPSISPPGTMARTMKPRNGVKPLAARVAVTGPRVYLYL